MNVHLRTPECPTTQAAEGLPRRKWTLAEIEALAEQGVFGGVDRERERFELVGGEIVPMSPKGSWHENVKRALNIHWVKALPAGIDVLTETTLRAGPHDFRKPDFVFWPNNVTVSQLRPEHVLFLVEVSDSSLAYDRDRKADYYASLGIPDYWVVDARRLVTRIHRQPQENGYAQATDHPPTERLAPLHIPALAVVLADLGLLPSD